MEKEKLIQEISQSLEILKKHTDRLKKNPENMHQLDTELMMEKTRKLYDQWIQLDALTDQLKKEIHEQPEPEVKMGKKPTEEVVPESEQEKIEEELPPAEELPETEETPVSEESAEKIPIEEKFSDDEVTKEEEMKGEINNDMETEEKIIEEEDAKSTIDLFSTTEPTVSDKYSEQHTVTVADRINKEGINEFREAIGINEKFLFINELFNGDMSKYNKVIDELDSFSTFKGAETYLLELKVQNQWAEDHPAFIKLLELLKRKFDEE